MEIDMKDDLTRREFLRAAGLAAAGLAGAALFSRSAQAQQEEKKEEKKEEPKKDGPKEEEEKKEEPNYDDLFEKSKDDKEEETRACPQCGALMYRQGRTWTCENCGYSYVE
jgi:ribosomal protein S27AE